MRQFASTLVLAVWWGCRNSEPVTRSGIVGCYDLQWTYTRIADTSSFLKSVLPPTLRLDTNGLVGTVEPKAIGNLGTSSSWEIKNGHSVLVLWSSGFGGLFLELRPRGDTLRGNARLVDDAGGDYRIAHVRGSPIRCSANRS
jgi:hypothetical protein